MDNLLKAMFEFVTQRLGIEGVSLIFLVIAGIYIWYQHNRAKLLQERIALIEEKRKDMYNHLETDLSGRDGRCGQGLRNCISRRSDRQFHRHDRRKRP